MILGIADSVLKEKDYDPIDTIHFAVENKFSLVQVYVSESLIKDKRLQKIISNVASNNSLKLTCHSPITLGQDKLLEDFIKSAQAIMKQERVRKTVFHFDETTSLNQALTVIKKLQQNDLIVCIENYFSSKNKKSVKDNIKKYLSLFAKAKSKDFPILPILDLPRFFDETNNIIDEATDIVQDLVQQLNNLNYSIILHLIDSKSHNQERKNWCPFNEGVIPYERLFEHFNQLKVNIDHIVFEFEDTINTIKSKQNLLQLENG